MSHLLFSFNIGKKKFSKGLNEVKFPKDRISHFFSISQSPR